MPELPEVENVRRSLESLLVDTPRITRFVFLRRDLRDAIPVQSLRQLEGQRLVRVRRRAKYLLLDTEAGTMLSHLGMTGSWRCEPEASVRDRAHDHIHLFLEGGRVLVYNDPRRFGIFERCDNEALSPRLCDLGPEPLSSEFTAETLWLALRTKCVPIKVALMDQRVVVGVGNIYASEALFRAGVKPQLRSHQLSLARAGQVVGSVREVLSQAIAAGGSTISDYRDADGRVGSFQSLFRVYDRAGEPCLTCQGKIRQKVYGGRSTFWCARCQR